MMEGFFLGVIAFGTIILIAGFTSIDRQLDRIEALVKLIRDKVS